MTDAAVGLPPVDAAMLTPLVRAALAQNDATIADWRHEPYGHSLDEVYGTARTIFRYSGTARTRGRDAAWTLVLKVVAARSADAAGDPASPANHDREPLAYQSGFLDRISGVRAPRCFGVTARPGGGSWLWLENVVDDIGREWPRERYLLAARHLGEFNGARAADGASALPWLSRSPLGEAVRETTAGVARIREARDNPYVAEAISPDAADALLDLLENIHGWLEQLDRLPQTICHWDAHRANLMSRTTPAGVIETVAIDWAGVGWGPFGAETSKLLSQTVNFFGMREDALAALDADIFRHYVDGLAAAGWSGDVRAVRFGHTAASAARLVVRTATALELAFNERARAGFERASGLPFAALAAKFRATLPYYLSLAAEAGHLAKAI